MTRHMHVLIEETVDKVLDSLAMPGEEFFWDTNYLVVVGPNGQQMFQGFFILMSPSLVPLGQTIVSGAPEDLRHLTEEKAVLPMLRNLIEGIRALKAESLNGKS